MNLDITPDFYLDILIAVGIAKIELSCCNNIVVDANQLLRGVFPNKVAITTDRFIRVAVGIFDNDIHLISNFLEKVALDNPEIIKEVMIDQLKLPEARNYRIDITLSGYIAAVAAIYDIDYKDWII